MAVASGQHTFPLDATMAGLCRLTPGCPQVDHASFQRLNLKYE